MMKPRISSVVLTLITLFANLSTVPAASTGNSTSVDQTQYVTYQETDGETVYLKDNRQPALYTSNYGDCLGSSLVNVTRFDAAYYKDNMTVLFHLTGNTALANESLMLYIGVFAYGESRFDLTFNPCSANIDSLCPMTSEVPIVASGIIPIGEQDEATIPAIALTIPDFEGQAILRIFANSTESEIGCYSAVVTNGNSFSHPTAVAPVLGIFALVTMLASFATAIYGEAIPTMRLHHAHSLSVGVVIAVFQHIFFTGALSMNWPSVLVAWWSNFAWAGGMIYSSSMQKSINSLIGNNVGNTSAVGAAPSGSTQFNLGGGYDISSIYKRSLFAGVRDRTNYPLLRDIMSHTHGGDRTKPTRRDMMQLSVERTLQRRDTALANHSTGYDWYGHPVGAGLPLPGNYSGFAGTLAEEGIRVSNAFMTGFLWFLILLVILVAAVVAFKFALEALARFRAIKQDRLKFFRDHWMGYSANVALRVCYLGFFLMMFLTIFEFTYQSSGGVKGVAGLVFAIFLVGIPGAAFIAYHYKINSTSREPHQQVEHKRLLGVIPWVSVKKTDVEATTELQAVDTKSGSQPFSKRMLSHGSIDATTERENIHDNEDYTKKFGWLSARFRRTRWWFFAIWIFYEFLRAVFIAGVSGYPLAQVFGLLVVEVVAFAYLIWARPFEGRRLNVIVVYCLGFSKVASVGLSAAFDIRFNLPRITTTVIGIVIIVIQGILTIITLIVIVISAISSYMSVSRNRENFRPRKWAGLREKYFDHLDRVVNDLPKEPKPAVQAPPEPEQPREPYFAMNSVRRLNKIEDDDEEFASEVRTQDPTASYLSLNDHRSPTPLGSSAALAGDGVRSGSATPIRGRSRAPSLQSVSATNLPFGARSHRPSWSTKDFYNADREGNEGFYTPIDMGQTVADDDGFVTSNPSTAPHSRKPSRSGKLPTQQPIAQSSSEALHVGGDLSTRDTIGRVPAPTIRPRAGTSGSNRGSRYLSWGPDALNDAIAADSQPGSQRASRHPLTPALEMDEFGAYSPKVSREG